MRNRDDMTFEQRIEWLESIVGVYGFLLAEKGLTIERMLRATIGNDLWLDGINDDDWHTLWHEIALVLLHHAQKRSERGIGRLGVSKIMRKVMVGQINGEGGREVEVTYDAFILAEFDPVSDLTAFELVQAHAVIGECRTFMEEEWNALQLAQRHWKKHGEKLGPGYIQHDPNQEG